MKKFLFVMLALLAVVLPVFGQADEVRNLTDEQLRTLYDAVSAEMSRRGMNSVDLTLGEGKYIIGKDIPAGHYTVTCLSTDGESLNSAYGSLGSAYDSMSGGGDSWSSLFGALGNMLEQVSELEIEILGDYGDVLKKVTLKKDASTELTLSEGTALQISEGSARLTGK